jgi:hypothetical protein
MHVIQRHPQLVLLMDELLETIEYPEAVTPDPKPGRWRYWRGGIGPTKWVRVVVAWAEGPPSIVTAFPTGRFDLDLDAEDEAP